MTANCSPSNQRDSAVKAAPHPSVCYGQGQIVNTSAKGDALEEAFYQYLVDLKATGQALFGIYSADACQIFKQKPYFDPQRKGDVKFDVVIEVTSPGRTEPQLRLVFECKNYVGSIPEPEVVDLSDKLGRLFQNGAKGFMVVASRLQSGAENLARFRNIGIIKFDENGLEIVADRKGGFAFENGFVKSQIFKAKAPAKSLKFSAYYDGRYFGSMADLLRSFDAEASVDADGVVGVPSVPYIPGSVIKDAVRSILKSVGYVGGPVDLEAVCRALAVDLQFTNQQVLDADGMPILGSAYFDRNLISIYAAGNPHRQRFTLGHEIGHFCLEHKQYLKSETIIQNDLLINKEAEGRFNYERLEYQANVFSSNLLLPDEYFRSKIEDLRERLDIKDRGHGYIFVDDQPSNYMTYLQLLFGLSTHFRASKRAVEIKLKSHGMVTDQRHYLQAAAMSDIVARVATFTMP